MKISRKRRSYGREPITQCHLGPGLGPAYAGVLSSVGGGTPGPHIPEISEVGIDLFLGTVVAAMVSKETAWRMMIMLQKEDEERVCRSERPEPSTTTLRGLPTARPIHYTITPTGEK